ncbi:MAG: prephenate dehydrogenase [Candidatus Omnitrophica bacterium]|nr:prephenate dehydrogenase [Candidatus Omnitrophota bacterium]
MLVKKIGIVGIGLIGGSLGLAIKKYKLAKRVIGICRHRNTLQEALRRKAVDIATTDLNLLSDVDLVILATPVGVIKEIASLVSKTIRRNCIVTDVGSSKKEIVLKLEKLFCNYVGSHPLTGSHNIGVKFADPTIFKNSLCILTPTKNTSREVLFKIKELWEAVGARVDFLSPALHDKIIAFTSHLPHLVAFSLIDSLPVKYLKYSAGGLKDTTRLALSSPQLWRDIFISNHKETLGSLKQFKERISFLEWLISKRDAEGLYIFLKKIQRKRSKIL